MEHVSILYHRAVYLGSTSAPSVAGPGVVFGFLVRIRRLRGGLVGLVTGSVSSVVFGVVFVGFLVFVRWRLRGLSRLRLQVADLLGGVYAVVTISHMYHVISSTSRHLTMGQSYVQYLSVQLFFLCSWQNKSDRYRCRTIRCLNSNSPS